MLYLVIEHFRDPSGVAVYRRLRAEGRLAPAGLRYVASWTTTDFSRCFQVMETDEPALLEEWMDRWRDLIEFEVNTVLTSAEAQEALAPRL